MVQLDIKRIEVVEETKEEIHENASTKCEICGSTLVPEGRGGCMKCLVCGNSVGHCDV